MLVTRPTTSATSQGEPYGRISWPPSVHASRRTSTRRGTGSMCPVCPRWCCLERHVCPQNSTARSVGGEIPSHQRPSLPPPAHLQPGTSERTRWKDTRTQCSKHQLIIVPKRSVRPRNQPSRLEHALCVKNRPKDMAVLRQATHAHVSVQPAMLRQNRALSTTLYKTQCRKRQLMICCICPSLICLSPQTLQL